MSHQSSPVITQVSPENEPYIIAQVPEEKQKFPANKTEGERVRKKEGSRKRRSPGIFKKSAACSFIRIFCCGRPRYTTSHVKGSISTSTSTTLAAQNVGQTSPASSKSRAASGATQRPPSKSWISLIFCCQWGNNSITDRDIETPQVQAHTEIQPTPAKTIKDEEKIDVIQLETPEQKPSDVEDSAEVERKWLLDPIGPEHLGKKCLVLDLDETLVHSSFKTMQSDFVVPVEIENQIHNVYVIKRPGVDQFLEKMGELYEIVVFTASLSKYADPVLDKLDQHHVVKHRLFRESCYNHKGNYVKDLSNIGRELRDTIIIDNSPASYFFHPTNAVPISSWFNDPHDTELLDLIPFLEDLTTVDDVMMVLDCSNEANEANETNEAQ